MPASDRALTLTRTAAAAASDRLARDIVALDVSDHLVITDAFLICSAPNDRQVRAIVDAVEERLRLDEDARPVRREGDRDARWVLLDYVDLVVHVQHSEEREFYSLQRLWKDCPPIDLGDITSVPETGAGDAGLELAAARFDVADEFTDGDLAGDAHVEVADDHGGEPDDHGDDDLDDDHLDDDDTDADATASGDLDSADPAAVDLDAVEVGGGTGREDDDAETAGPPPSAEPGRPAGGA